MGKVSFKYWIKASRPKTLPVSMAPVVMSVALASAYIKINWLPAAICLVFAVLSQILSNFVNDYADGLKGIDNNRLGPRRMVASGLISPEQMRCGITVLCVLAFLIGCTLLCWGGLVLLPIGIVILLCAIAYSAGPFPLSQHGFGDIAVVLFYGLAPVVLTFFIQTGFINWQITIAGLAIGLLSDNLLIVNNVRDADEDFKNNKKTTVVLFGKSPMTLFYYLNPLIAMVLGLLFLNNTINSLTWIIASVPFVVYSTLVSVKFSKAKGLEFNKLIGMSSMESIVFALTVLIVIILEYHV